MNVVVWNSAIAGGGLLGGVLLEHMGAGSFSWMVLIFSLASLLIAFSARSHGFPAGHRQHRHVDQPIV
jgi:predicted MFS family arabinose efflux permease